MPGLHRNSARFQYSRRNTVTACLCENHRSQPSLFRRERLYFGVQFFGVLFLHFLMPTQRSPKFIHFLSFSILLWLCCCSCTSCGCNVAGSVAGTLCDPDTGTCSCKQFVTGASCDQCLTGYQNLEQDNPFGCSARENLIFYVIIFCKSPSPAAPVLNRIPPV